MHITATRSVDRPNTVGEKESQQNGNYQGSINYLFDNSALANKEAIDPELWNAIMSVKSSDLSGQQQVLMIDLLLALKTIRQQNVELWQKEAINSFETAIKAADKQERQALLNATASGISAAASGIQAAVELGSAAKGAYDTNKANAQAKIDTDAIDWTKPAATNAGATPDAGPTPTTPPPPYSASPDKIVGVDGEEIEMGDLPDKGKADAKGADEPDADAPREIDTRAKEEYLQSRMRNNYMQAELEKSITTSIGTLISSLMKGAAAGAEGQAGIEGAEATVQKAVQEYLATQSQYAQSHANEIQQTINSIIDYIKTAEQARHQAASSIANVA